jgi:hypothetical protein
MPKQSDLQPVSAHRVAVASSPDKVLSIHIAARPGGIAVQRTEQRPGGRRLVQSIRFEDEVAFVRWCESDDLWFAYPLLFSEMARSGCALFRPAS